MRAGTGLLLLTALVAQADETRNRGGIPTVRVLVGEGLTSIDLECQGPVNIVKPNWPRPLLSLLKLPESKLTLEKGKFALLGKTFEEPWLTFEVRSDVSPLKVGKRRYAQKIHFVKDGDKFKIVSQVDLEQYLLGVVGSEIGNGAPQEAMRVQAICARSYAFYQMGGLSNQGPNRPLYDVVDDTRSQVYIGVPESRNAEVEKAVAATAGLIVTYKGRPICTYFSSSCGGSTRGIAEWTGGAEIPPLSGVKCGFCDGYPNANWQKKFSLAELGEKFKDRTGGRPITSAVVSKTTRSGRAEQIELQLLNSRPVTLSAKEFVDLLDLRNNNFKLKLENRTTLVIDGGGYGHGVGMCQFGAIELAKRGKTYKEIIAHYFPQSQLTPMYQAGVQRCEGQAPPEAAAEPKPQVTEKPWVPEDIGPPADPPKD